MNILEKANEILFKRAEEKERQYGSFESSMKLVAELFNSMTNHKYGCTPEDMYKAMIAMKLARQSNAHKKDNLLDAIVYMAALNEQEEKNLKKT